MANKNKDKNKDKLKAALTAQAPAPTVDDTAAAPAIASVADAPKTVKKAERGEAVKDGNGRVMFRKKSGVAPLPQAAKYVDKPTRKVVSRKTTTAIPSNPTTLKFPTDRWGVTKDVKRAMIDMASRLAGDERKKELADEVIAILTQYVNDKFARDQKLRETRLERATAKTTVVETDSEGA